jgi:hypothetical protein
VGKDYFVRLGFFILLLLAVVLNGIALMVGGHPGVESDELVILVALGCELFALGIIVWRGKVFQPKGRWVFLTEPCDPPAEPEDCLENEKNNVTAH